MYVCGEINLSSFGLMFVLSVCVCAHTCTREREMYCKVLYQGCDRGDSTAQISVVLLSFVRFVSESCIYHGNFKLNTQKKLIIGAPVYMSYFTFTVQGGVPQGDQKDERF